jgi:hypothetical protein
MNSDLEMLSQRELLMEDIDSICDGFFCENFPASKDQYEELVALLCDAVCKNFPTN